MRSLDRFLYFDRNGDVSEAPDLDTILPVLGGEVTAAASSRRLKRLTVAPAALTPVAATGARREKQRNRHARGPS